MALAVVPEEEVGGAGQAPGTALHRDPAVLAGFALAELGKVVEVDLHVAAHEEVEVAVLVVVGEAAARRPAAALYPRLLGDVGERAVPVVAVEPVPAEGGDVEVRGAIPVHVGHAHPHPPARVRHPGGLGHVHELPVAQVPVERALRGPGVLGCLHGQGIDEVDVEEAVTVEIEEGHASAH